MDSKKIFDYATKTIKDKLMSSEQSDRSKHADTIIRNHVIWSMGAGFIPILIADIFAVSALQLDMIRQMCRVYDVDFSETQGKAIVTSLTSSTLARIGAGSLVKMIPGVGSLLGGAAVSVFAGASTYALGQVFKRHFESGGTILDFDPARLKKMYKEQFEKGKKVAEQWRKEQKEHAEEEIDKFKEAEKTAADTFQATDQTSVIEKLKELAQLKEQGIISEAEFQQMKDKLIQGF
ncbi:MAG TPA: DUF697 domain-containing protein [Saprospiraceae bacterium]|nr:DUF697 domain-containing protein [Saprospiraceae bacterium]HMQ85027.1 DUF697 domain-containing protein [Saprospiraceae bacterium]